jgi:enoyl-CoA hydratase/carnithine racemase
VAPALLRRDGPVAVIALNRPQARKAVNAEVAVAVGRCADVVEGARAFAQKRAPQWQGA